MAHTPGPWHVYRGGNFTKVAPNSYDARVKKEHYLGGAICDIDDWTGERHDPKAPWIEPNAHLIAAAPDMLVALKRAEQAIHSEYCTAKCHRECVAVADIIAKAEGRL